MLDTLAARFLAEILNEEVEGLVVDLDSLLEHHRIAILVNQVLKRPSFRVILGDTSVFNRSIYNSAFVEDARDHCAATIGPGKQTVVRMDNSQTVK